MLRSLALLFLLVQFLQLALFPLAFPPGDTYPSRLTANDPPFFGLHPTGHLSHAPSPGILHPSAPQPTSPSAANPSSSLPPSVLALHLVSHLSVILLPSPIISPRGVPCRGSSGTNSSPDGISADNQDLPLILIDHAFILLVLLPVTM